MDEAGQPLVAEEGAVAEGEAAAEGVLAARLVAASAGADVQAGARQAGEGEEVLAAEVDEGRHRRVDRLQVSLLPSFPDRRSWRHGRLMGR